jgi:hypothetical protein
MQPDIKKLLSDFLPGGSGDEEVVLGVVVAEQNLHALLIERSGEGTHVVRRFTRRRGSDFGAGGNDFGAGGGVPDLEGEEATGDDFNIQFGEGGGGGDNLFLGSEFGEIEGEGGGEHSFGAGGAGGSSTVVSDFSLELSDLLEECRSAGHPDPALAFCLPATDVTQLELPLTDVDASPEAPATVDGVGRKKLRRALEAQYEGELEKGRYAFLPMTPADDGSVRFLALVGQPTDPVVSTLRAMKSQNERLPGRGLLETEVSLYFGLARAALQNASAEEEDALVVRVGQEDTLALFTSGASLRQSETLRSLNAQDSAETVCSRVLLLQDEYGIEDMQHVFVAADAKEDALVESFEMFFPEAHVEPLARHLPAEATEGENQAANISAATAALRFSGHAGYERAFEDVDLLPPKLLIRRFELPFSNAVPLLLVLLTVAGIFFGVRYRHMAGEQEEVRQRLATYPENFAEATPQELQAEIDSTQAASERYMDGLAMLDELLMGSDQWSHALSEISRETAAVSGIWVDQWTPQSSAVRLSGNATNRDRIVQLAERAEGEIKSVTFSEIREWPVYSFTMEVPLKTGLPEATKYLREQALAADGQDGGGQDGGASGQNAGGQPDTDQ